MIKSGQIWKSTTGNGIRVITLSDIKKGKVLCRVFADDHFLAEDHLKEKELKESFSYIGLISDVEVK